MSTGVPSTSTFRPAVELSRYAALWCTFPRMNSTPRESVDITLSLCSISFILTT